MSHMIYRSVSFWPEAFHVFVVKDDGTEDRIGIVNRKPVRINGKVDRVVWFAHNRNFFSIVGEYSTRTEAAQAIPKGSIHQDIDALSGSWI